MTYKDKTLAYAERLLLYRNLHANKYGRRLSQIDMAKLIGCNLNTYVKWEYGANMPGEKYRKAVDKLLLE